MENIWAELKSSADKNGYPFTVLAPMEDVTDTVFRQVLMSVGRPDLFFTEFTSSTGMLSGGAKYVTHRLEYQPDEHPIIAQIWGTKPEHYLEATREVVKLGFDGVDINMGCPVAKIIQKGACSALIKQPDLAVEIIKATQEGADGKIPVSVKTRIGFDTVVTEEWTGLLLDQNLAALTVHGRTVNGPSNADADWEEIAKVVALRDSKEIDTVIVGNGDIRSISQGDELAKESGVDGIMVGRGVFENQWIFNRSVDEDTITKEMRLDLLKKHLELYRDTWEGRKHFGPMKKFVKAYVRGFEGAAEFRNELMSMDSADEMINLLQNSNE